MGDTRVGGTRESPVPMASGRPQGWVPARAQAPAVQRRFTRPPLALPANPALSRTPMTRTTLLTAALLLASDDGNFICGQVFGVNGGAVFIQ